MVSAGYSARGIRGGCARHALGLAFAGGKEKDGTDLPVHWKSSTLSVGPAGGSNPPPLWPAPWSGRGTGQGMTAE